MPLNAGEAEELRRLMSTAKYGTLGPEQERRMRFLIGRETPSSEELPLADLFAVGLMLLGLLATLGLLAHVRR